MELKLYWTAKATKLILVEIEGHEGDFSQTS